MLSIYRFLTGHAQGLFNTILAKRLSAGKEDETRINERRGIASRLRPNGNLVWIHAASVGEAQSALIIIHHLLARSPDLSIMITTGTKTSANLMAQSLPPRAFHQFIPLDHPQWVENFITHWQPNFAIWIESELWPNTLNTIRNHNIPAILINARMSPKSQSRWRLIKKDLQTLLRAFNVILTQSEHDTAAFHALGIAQAKTAGNIKYSAAPLAHNADDLSALQTAIQNRPIIVYASTHDGEESIAATLHNRLEKDFPTLLSIIIPRHPERGAQIVQSLTHDHNEIVLRGADKTLPMSKTRLYIANTLGELGLFYRLTDIAFIGRSLSNDGGGGHNPLEAAQLNCAIIHGKNTQNLADIYKAFDTAKASLHVHDEASLYTDLHTLLSSEDQVSTLAQAALELANNHSKVIDTIMADLLPLLPDKEEH